jgi:hypothetical protein
MAGGSSPRGRTVFTVEEKKGGEAFRKDTGYKSTYKFKRG